MKSFHLLLLISTIVCTFAFKVNHEENKIISAPVLVVYPIAQQCEFRTYNYFEQILNTTSKCFEVGADSHWLIDRIFDVNVQGEKLCQKLYQDEAYKKGNFSIVAFSYGGMLGRYVLEYCDFEMPIRNFVTFGSPLNGVSALPHTMDPDEEDKLSNPINDFIVTTLNSVLNWLVNFDFFDRILRSADFWRNPKNYSTFLKNSRFLAQANNEVNFDQTRKDKWMKLSNAMFIKFDHDTVIAPTESEWWGQYDEDYHVMTRQQTRLYKEDLLGLKAIEQQGKVNYLSLPGDHMQFNFTQVYDHVIPLLRR